MKNFSLINFNANGFGYLILALDNSQKSCFITVRPIDFKESPNKVTVKIWP